MDETISSHSKDAFNHALCARVCVHTQFQHKWRHLHIWGRVSRFCAQSIQLCLWVNVSEVGSEIQHVKTCRLLIVLLGALRLFLAVWSLFDQQIVRWQGVWLCRVTLLTCGWLLCTHAGLGFYYVYVHKMKTCGEETWSQGIRRVEYEVKEWGRGRMIIWI